MEADEFHDPLAFNLQRQTRDFLSKLQTHDDYAISISNSNSTSQLLVNLSRALAVPAYTTCIATLFRPILFDLCARWIENSVDAERELEALCLLIEVHEELFPILYRLLEKPVFCNGPAQCVTDASVWDANRAHRVLLAYYRILQANRELPYQLYWPLTPLHLLASGTHSDNAVRLLAIRCYALQSGMGEAQREKWEKEALGELYGVDCPLAYGEDLNGVQVTIDGWLMPVIELERVRTTRNAIVTEPQDFYSFEEDNMQSICPSDLCPLVANLHGVLCLRSSVPENAPSSLVPTPTTVHAIRTLALHLSMRLPTLVTSPPSSGKTLLLSYLAENLFPEVKNQLIFIHLADTSLDPRSLLGTYVSSKAQTGTFEWKEGVLVRAMREGKWVVFKDIDRGSNEVLALIKPLIESLGLGKWIGGRASIEIPGRGKVVAADGFAIFATRSILPSRNGTIPAAVFFGSHKLYEVTVGSPSSDELRLIVDSRYPRLAGLHARGLIRLWEAVMELGSTASTRDVGLRELEKLCIRMETFIPPSPQPVYSPESDEALPLSRIFPSVSLREEIFLGARDVFFGSGTMTAAAKAHVDSIAITVGNLLELEPERQQWLLSRWLPDFDIERDKNGRSVAVRVGRVRLPAQKTKLEIAPTANRPFAMHRPATLLLSRIATSVSLSESVLLTGETGTGKTSVITHLANILHQPLLSLNLSNQTESSDLIGGFRPLDARVPALALQSRFLDLFGETFSRKKNEKFEADVRKSVAQGNWKRVVGLWKESIKLAKDRIMKKQREAPGEELDSDIPRKRRKLDASTLSTSEGKWSSFEHDVDEFGAQYVSGKARFAFGFVEGPLVQALRHGDWVLLDEINLASPETLECISSILRSPTSSVTLTEQGSLEPVPRHPNFRLFACMNPATDVGKKDLPPNIRSRFTEIDVPPPDADRETLLSIVTQYIGSSAVSDKAAIMNVAEFYLAVKELAETRQIADGSNHRPHYSMRTLARALTFASDIAGSYGLRRAIWEGCLMAFTMVLDTPSAELVTSLAQKHLLAGVKNPRSLLAKDPSIPPSRSQEEFVKLGPFYLEKGPLLPDPADDYILTPSVETKLVDLARIILTRRFPVLIEGPTSSGKTSSVEYLAKRTGHRFIRINNHEHTDIQEYLGSYVPHPDTGKLVFTDGLLVRALRNGDWIVLDELNLAPTDVLEALNRLLDDNRELIIPETGEIIRPHPHFMIFATQNPPGLYAGRKVLSRAFRNRFLEVHFEDVPEAELETILCQRSAIAPSYGKKIVSVFRELQKRRQSGRVFESKQSFATLRDLFRWAGRDAVGYQELAENGYMLLAERARREIDKTVVKEVIESTMGVKVDENTLYDIHVHGSRFEDFLGFRVPASSDLVWTKAMQRLFVLLSRALRFNEPVLLVGETGSGKTSVCQVFADATSAGLRTLNCHQNTETADLIGGLRPVRNRASIEADISQHITSLSFEMGSDLDTQDIDALALQVEATLKFPSLPSATREMLEGLRNRIAKSKAIFEWHDGPLVEAMHNGDVFLLDEISLADDSVLERLNSVLEPSRTLVLAEKAGDDLRHSSIIAHESFKLVATMNPGGDYGKKELSPALRNRFTEIWVPSVDDRNDLELIVSCMWKYEPLRHYTTVILDFVHWLCHETGDSSFSNLRDILGWVTFSNTIYDGNAEEQMSTEEIFHHAAHMTYLDGLGSVPSLSSHTEPSLRRLKLAAVAYLNQIVPFDETRRFTAIRDDTRYFQLGPFSIEQGPEASRSPSFNFAAPTTQTNAMRVVRACQLSKPILLEGSPGVGKTSLITALAKVSGHELCRINLSDQTDLIDLFGSDLPVENGGPGEFAWKDGEFLRALQTGRWVLLDEMNLAPQAVLEGLNAVLDHRGSVYIPELGRTFIKHPAFRIFAAQNPLSQGGGRKGLPKSFVNRFTKVYIDQLSSSDLLLVCQHLHPDVEPEVLQAMITFNTALHEAVSVERAFGKEGAPWEFNLRDVLRWTSVLQRPPKPEIQPVDHLRMVYLHRFRNSTDRLLAQSLFDRIFGSSFDHSRNPSWTISPSEVTFGQFHSERQNLSPSSRPKRLLKSQLSALEAVGCSISQSSLAILTGARNSGKTDLVRMLANITGRTLQEVHINSATDAMDILGGFEQVEPRTRLRAVAEEVLVLVERQLRSDTRSSCDTGTYASLRQMLSNKTILDPESVLGMISKLTNAFAADSEFFAGISAIRDRIEEISRASAFDSAGRFEWTDGPLVHALKAGDWLLLDGANLCNPSVLDRLNSLCESDGFLTMSEKGFVHGRVEVLKPHPNFRLFMTVDPQYGELSRAMRNRGIEVALISSSNIDDQNVLHDHHRLPSVTTLRSHISPSLFAAMRMGVHCIEDRPQTLSMPFGRALDQDSTLSHLVDGAPVLLQSANDGGNDEAVYQFLSRSMTPSMIPLVSRFLGFSVGHRDDLFTEVARTILSRAVEAVSGIRNAYSSGQALSLSHMLEMPIDFYLGVPASALEHMLQHSTVLKVLQIAVAVTLQEIPKLPQAQRPASSEDQRTHRTVAAVYSVLNDVHNAGMLILQAASATGDILTLDVQVLTSAQEILNHARHLKDISSRRIIDYSALQPLAEQVAAISEKLPEQFSLLKASATELRECTTLATGLGINQIWTLFFESTLATDEIERLEELASEIGTSELRRQVLNLQAMSALSRSSAKSPSTLAMLEDLRNRVDVRSADRVDNDRSLETSHLVTRLGLLAAISKPLSRTYTRAINNLITIACDHSLLKLQHVSSYQQLLWFDDALREDSRQQELQLGSNLALLSNTSSILSALLGRWMVDIWEYEDEGPAALLRPAHLESVLSVWNWTMTPMARLSEYETVLQSHIQLALLNTEQCISRPQQLSILLQRSILQIASCFGTVESKDPQIVVDGDDTEVDAFELPALGEALDHPVFRRAVETYLKPAFTSFDSFPQDRKEHLAKLGSCWISTGRLMLELFIPDAPIDPAAIQNHVFEFWRRRAASLSSELLLHSELETMMTGNSENGVTAYLRTCLVDANARLEDAPSLIAPRDVPRVQMFWSEVWQFQKHVLDPSKLDQLIPLLKAGDESANLREQVFQRSARGFVQRLQTAYKEFDDIIFPISYAVFHFQMGLRILKQCNEHNHSGTTTATSLTAFPAIRSAGLLIAQRDELSFGLRPFQRLVLIMAAITLEFAAGVYIDSHIQLIDTTYEQASRLWLIDHAQAEHQQKLSESLYRQNHTSHDVVSDAELEEREFAELFPSFESTLSNEASVSDSSSDPSPTLQVSELEMKRFVHLHGALFSGVEQPLTWYRSLQMSVLPVLLESHKTRLADSLDRDALPLCLSLLDDRNLEFQKPMSSRAKPYNFYADPNIQEIRKAASVVTKLKERLNVLIREWPDQMVLQHLRERCNAVLALDLRSPVAKVLSALEQLLLHTEDWEIYAHKGNSLRDRRSFLIELIVEWRRLELSCWQVMLEAEARSFEDGVSPWWFHLYDATIRGPLDALQRDADGSDVTLSGYLDSLVPLLNDFIQGSPLGQFRVRLQLLVSFGEVCRNLAKVYSGMKSDVLARTRCIVHATVSHFSQFSSTIAADLASERSTLEVEVRNLIKLASWKDVNVHALKQSAQRTHHQLYKLIRKFREVLRKPVSGHLRMEMADMPEAQVSSFTIPVLDAVNVNFPFTNLASQPPTGAPTHLMHLDRTYHRYEDVVIKRIAPFISSKTPDAVDTLAVDIIVSAKELSLISIASSQSSERRDKQQKALLTRKRKAWSDLLKELKTAGFSARVKPEVLCQNESARWIREQPIMPESHDRGWDYQKSDKYWYRLNGLMPAFRASIPSHHADISTRELQRGAAFLESGFAMAADSRARLARAFGAYNELQQHLRRIRSVASSDSIVYSGQSLLQQIMQLSSTLSKTASALQELQNVFDSFLRLDPSGPIAPAVITSAQGVLTSCSDLEKRFKSMTENVRLSAFPILLTGEHRLVSEVHVYLETTLKTMRLWIEEEPRLRAHLSPIIEWLQSHQSEPSLIPSAEETTSISADEIINMCLAGVQTMLAKSSDSPGAEDRDHYIRDDYHDVRDFTSLFKIGQIVELLNGSLAGFAAGSAIDVNRYLPFLELYTQLVYTQLTSHAHWTKALLKLTYVLCSVLTSVSQQGFCKPPEADNEGASGDGAVEMSDGVGLGEGSGADNVSKEIEDESQVEGLQGDEADGKEPRDDKDNDAIEMSEDIGGEMEDVPDDGPQDEDGADQESNADPEEQVGDLDASDPAAVDEKFWGDEKGPDDTKDQADQKTNKETSEQEQSGDSDVVAKEGRQKPDQKEEKPAEEHTESRDDAEDVAQDDIEDDQDGDRGEDDDHPDASGAPMDQSVPESETLDLPDDMAIDSGDGPEDLGEQMDVGDEEDGMDESEQPVPDAEDQQGENADSSATAPDEAEEEVGDDGNEMDAPVEAAQPETNDFAEEENNAVARPDIGKGDGDVTEDAPNPDQGQNAASNDSGTSMAMSGEAAAAAEKSDDATSTPEVSKPSQETAQDTSPAAGAATNGMEHGPQPSQPNNQLSNNPLRTIADALKEVQRRFDEILDSGTDRDVPREQLGASEQSAPVEYLRPEDTDHDMQALGPAQDERVAKLQELKLLDGEAEEDQALAPQDVDMTFEPETHQEPPRPIKPSDTESGRDMESDLQGAVVNQDSTASFEHGESSNTDGPTDDVDMEDVEDPNVELELRHWQAAGLPDNGAEHIWRLYESLTHDLAYALCEQLRLILEPTLATRLKGDYRTGKRLNMKKIIPYIASDYTKDKIWLRRTRPSQREYQVLIAIDDSRSMAESHSVHLAYQTLALVSKALTRLEAGDIGIAKFGQDVHVLHGFDGAPFSDQAGVEVMKAFRFDQKATNVLSLVDVSLRVLEAARERRSMSSGSAADLWQLEIIISDGMCQDHDKLRAVLRKAEEQRVMIVFIIVDSLHSAGAGKPGLVQGSILSMDKAEFKNVDGKMELKLERYLDSFPFEYYVVLRNVEALPEVLSTTLKQFFERISEE